MTELRQEKLNVRCADLNGVSSLPHLCDAYLPHGPGKVYPAEDDELFLNYGGINCVFPYRAQDRYTRELSIDGLDALVLENEHLRASFIPSLGGKLWSLFDKDAGKELLFANPVFRPAQLAMRNAWASGGVEWNCGAYTGHHPYTCSPIFAAKLSPEDSGLGCPVLRLYSYERIRGITQQMDFYLPEDSHFLHCRMRVVNDSFGRTDMYWWSNIAVPTDKNSRVVVPADAAYAPFTDEYEHVTVPYFDNRDVTYPTNNPIAIDYFFKTYENHRYYTSHIGKDGYGFVQTSTSKLKGRKLFVWGQGPGGEKWQEFLAGDNGRGVYSDGKYCEIQCGLAHSQYECIPMPPVTAWEWIEYYGSIQTDPEKIHGEWHGAQAELEARLSELATAESLEKELIDTKKMAKTPATEQIQYGEGWAALENERRKTEGLKPISPHLDFGKMNDDQRVWKKLLASGTMRNAEDGDPSKAPLSYQRADEWIRLMRNAVKGADRFYWLTHYHLGCAYLATGDDRAEEELAESCHLNENAWNTYALAECYRVKGDQKRCAATMLTAAGYAPEDESLCIMTALSLNRAKMWQALYDYTATLAGGLAKLPRVRLYRAIAAVKLDNLETAETLLFENGGIEIPDIMEGEESLTELWYEIEEKKAKKDGREFDRSKAKPPKNIDFRMMAAE